MKEGKEFESLKAKLKKLKALAEKGVGGEAINAQRLLERLCAENDISLDDLDDETKKKRYTFNVGRSRALLRLFAQCAFKVTKSHSVSYVSESRSEISVELTAIDYAELKGLFEWHKANFERELEDIRKTVFTAYCRKHRLFYDGKTEDNDSHELTPEEIERLLKALKMESMLSNETCQHLIEQ